MWVFFGSIVFASDRNDLCFRIRVCIIFSPLFPTDPYAHITMPPPSYPILTDAFGVGSARNSGICSNVFARCGPQQPSNGPRTRLLEMKILRLPFINRMPWYQRQSFKIHGTSLFDGSYLHLLLNTSPSTTNAVFSDTNCFV